MRFGTLAGGPDFQQLAFLAQLGEFALAKARRVADPHVHIALIRLRQRAEAAHQEQTVDRSRRITAVAWLVGKRSGQALSLGERIGVGLEAGQSSRRAAGDVARKQRMVDMKKQRQQGQYALLARRQPFHGAGHATFVQFEKAGAQLTENLAVDSFVQIGADFMGAGHFSSNRLAGRGR